MDTVLASVTVSVTELKRNFANILKEVENTPVAVLNHNIVRRLLRAIDLAHGRLGGCQVGTRACWRSLC